MIQCLEGFPREILACSPGVLYLVSRDLVLGGGGIVGFLDSGCAPFWGPG